MIVGTGIDIVEIERIESVYQRRGERFASHVLHAEEFPDFNATQYKAHFLAKRFAVKEAATKALGTGQAKNVLLRHFYISHDDNGRPMLHACDQALALCQQLGVTAMHVSIADESAYAVASVILERA
jgi:holo-[acyl-carrier protein] synthase